MHSRAILLAVVGVVWSLPFPEPARADEPPNNLVDLREVARWAAREPPAVQAADARALAAELAVASARAQYAPTLYAQSDLELRRQQQLYFVPSAPNQKTKSDSTRVTASVRAEWLLFDFLGRPAEVRRARELRTVARESSIRAELESVRAASELYVGLLTTQRLRDNAALSSARRSAVSSAVGRLVAAGLRPRVDLQRAELEALAARSELAVLSARTAVQAASLSAAMGRDPATPLAVAEIDDALLEVELPERELGWRARDGRPEIRAQQARIEAGRAAAAVARARQLPTLHLFAGASFQRDELLRGNGIDGNASLVSGGLSLRWNLFNLPNTRDVRLALAELEVEITTLRDTLLNAHTAALVGQREVVTAREALAQAIQILEAATSARDAQSRRYEAGEASLLELLDAEQVEQDARSRRILAQRELSLARIALMDALGTLKQRLVD